ncbi:hypothetical protein M885DRAFT_446982 [Pelagophyceae sp. CCMP2097]|nr:hypothetical protein M885DRAFT_446982 [Pelagophyceae sp. CCMP2097]|mmetsp:Transcript_13559/g.45207  ORF Transcript_13559/g.45207 Transcript_13559/m.45207 type:complete len:223 (-) Transcript_13559:80-748(-)|eukprot:CAMPEP_0184098834 /NCGR_PEP_ID=MMETSP0974-20121125/11513_1 /TAXON_ID=483370 /ORGANISM="non described non described, Strain CCMP2097" /LENGTH=222 /DNA_ID=CAMNT_0026401727 /DNA_START=66 /DNA_END=734 /DNA_ORIENTATION=-
MAPPALALKLYYFDVDGKGQAIRLLCAHLGLALQDHRFASRDEFHALKADGTLPFGQVPLLEVTDAAGAVTRIAQSNTILRFIAKLGGAYPTDALSAAAIDSAMDQEVDAFVGPTVISYSTRFGIALDEAQTAAAVSLIATETFPRHLGFVEALLGQSDSGWIAGTPEPSPADFVWGTRLGTYLPSRDHIFPEALRNLDGYPRCKAFVAKFKALPAVAGSAK